MKKLLVAGSALLLLGLCFTAQLSAAIIPGVSIAAVSSEYIASAADVRAATNLINGCGLFGAAETWNITGSGWLTSDNSDGAYSNAFVTFDLGAVHQLDHIKIYNYNEASTTTTAGTSNGVQRADILFGTVPDVYTFTNANVLLNKAPGTLRDFSQDISAAGTQARYVRINILTNWGGVAAALNKVGLSKVLFIDTNVTASATSATVNFSSNAVTVWFSESVTPATAADIANYSLTAAADSPTILSATMGAFNDSVVLQTSPLTNGPYTLAMTNIAVVTDGTTITNALPVQTQLAFWLKADVGVVTNGSLAVTDWLDQSGNGNNASQVTSNNQPTYVASDINGLPTVKFGSMKFMDVPFSSTISGTRDVAVFAVVKVTSKANNEIVSRAVVNRAAPLDYRYTSTAAIAYRGNDGGGGSYGSATATTNFPTGQPALTVLNITGTNAFFYLNGLNNGGGQVLAGVRDSQNPTRVGGRIDNGAYFNGSISELMVFRTGVSDSDRLAINAYLASKYALTITDLAFSKQPSSTNVLEGQTANFGALAIASSTNAITYQWKTNNVDILNATNALYRTSLLTLADNNTVFTVVAKSGTNTVTSSSATLTVGVDTIAPTLTYAGIEIWDTNKIVVVFSKSVADGSATDMSNYVLDNGVTINAAVMGGSPNKVVLSVSGLTSGASYQLSAQNVQDLFGNVLAAVQVPVSVYPHVALWLKADAGIITDGSTNVLEWDDQSGNANNTVAVISSLSSPPTFVSDAFNGQPVVHFDGVGNYLAGQSSPSLAITGDLSIYTAISFTDYGSQTGVAVVGKTGGTGMNIPNPFDFYAGPTDGRLRFYRGNGGAGGSGVSYESCYSTKAPSLGVTHIVGVSQLGTTVTHYLDGVTNGTGQIDIVSADSGTPFGVGTRNDLQTKMKGNIAELMVFDVGFDAADHLALDNLLGAKYGVAIGPVVQPTLTIAAVGNNATISWPVSASAYALESTISLPSAFWSAVTNTISTNAGVNTITISTANGQAFYRLRKN